MMPSDRANVCRPRVLTLISNPSVRTRLHQRLECDCQLWHAPDSVTALLTLAQRSVDLLVLADNPPSLDGYTLAHLLRQHLPTLPIVLLVAQADTPTQDRADCDLCLPKPWDATLIAASVLVLLKRRPAQIVTVPLSGLVEIDPQIAALVLELEAVEQLLERDQRVQQTRRIHQAIGQLKHTKRRLAALAGRGQQ